MLVPLLGTGLIQAVHVAAMVGGRLVRSSNPTNAFRVGVDGLTAPLPPASQTLPQPLYPGVNSVAAGAGEALDPNFRPNVVDSFTLTFQRQLTQQGQPGNWLHRTPHQQRIPAHQPQRCSVHDDQGRTDASPRPTPIRSSGTAADGNPNNMGGGNCTWHCRQQSLLSPSLKPHWRAPATAMALPTVLRLSLPMKV